MGRRLEKRRAELQHEGLCGEGEKKPLESVRTLSRHGKTDLVGDSDARKFSHQVEAALQVPTSPLHMASGNITDGRTEQRWRCPLSAKRGIMRDALKSQIPEVSLSAGAAGRSGAGSPGTLTPNTPTKVGASHLSREDRTGLRFQEGPRSPVVLLPRAWCVR